MVGVDDYRAQLLSLAGEPVPLGQLVSFTAEPLVARAVVLHLCWTGELAVDLSGPLEDTTIVGWPRVRRSGSATSATRWSVKALPALTCADAQSCLTRKLRVPAAGGGPGRVPRACPQG